LEYISIIVIVVGFLFSLFQKKAQEENNKKGQKKPTPVKPDFTKQVIRKMEQAFEAPVKKETVSTKVNELNELEALKKERDALKQKLKRMEAASVRHVKAEQKAEPLLGDKGLLEGHSLAEAVIFAEIIGAPRAKRPHPATRKKQGIKQ